VILSVVCHLKLENRKRASPGDVRKLSLRRQSIPVLAEYEFPDGVCRMAPDGGVTKRHNLASGFLISPAELAITYVPHTVQTWPDGSCFS
jgi:hypothetical protein